MTKRRRHAGVAVHNVTLSGGGGLGDVQPHHLAPAWIELCRRVEARDDVAGVGAGLLAAYGSPTRRYHDLVHLAEVLEHVDELADVATDPEAVRLAGWFHDAVYDPARDDNEQRSAVLAAHELAKLRVPDPVIAEVIRLVLLTSTHEPTDDDRNGAVLTDADLAVLGRDPEGYAAYADAIRQEYASIEESAFRAGRIDVLQRLLGRSRIFHTSEGINRWETPARANVTTELSTLQALG